ncbi:MAG: beta/gamma crystallin-related protein, partial [Plesiomonas shigelloides]
MKINALALSIGVSLSLISVSPIALSTDADEPHIRIGNGKSRKQRVNSEQGESISESIIDVTGYYSRGNCGVELKVNGLGPIANNDVVKANTPVNIEISLLDSKTKTITGSENVIAFWEDVGNGRLQANGRTIFEPQEGRSCLITNVSIPGISRAKTITNNSHRNKVYFPNGEIADGPLRHNYTAAPILASIFLMRMKEDYSDEYVEGIPNDIGDDDFRLVKSGNVENYAKLMRDVLSGKTGINGASDAGYSIDFLDLKDKSAINAFLSKTLIRPAIEIGIIDKSLDSASFSDFLRKYILSELNQDSRYDYGTPENIKSSTALQYSKTTSNIQLDDGYYISTYLNQDYLLEEFKLVSKSYKKGLTSNEDRLQPDFNEPNEITLAIYNMSIDFKKWQTPGKGKVGDIYVYDNPHTKKTDIFRLKTANYGYFPTNSTSNNEWEFIGPKKWGEAGEKGDIYIYENPYNNAIDFFRLKGNSGAYYPIDQTSNNDWAYISPGGLERMSQYNLSPEDAVEFATLSNKYRGLDGIELSKAVLTSSGMIGVDIDNKIIYSTHKKGGLLGLNVAEIAAIAYGVENERVTSAQVSFTKVALENLLIDTLYGYGSLNNVKSSILNRIAYEVMDDALIEKLGTGEEPFILDELIQKNNELTSLSFESLVKNYVGLNFKLNGLIQDLTQEVAPGGSSKDGVKLFEHGDYQGRSITIDESVSDLSLLNFNDVMSSFDLPDGWEVVFYQHGNFTGKKYTRQGRGHAPINDQISSVKITKKPSTGVKLFEHGDFKGRSITLNESTPDLSTLSFNDIASSFEIPDGWEAVFYEHGNFSGKKYTRQGKGYTPINDQVSSVQIIKSSSKSIGNNKTVSDIIYDGLVNLDKAQEKLSQFYDVVAYDNGEKVETVPITDEMFSRSQLFKYGLNAKEVDDLWKPYLKKGYLSKVSDSRITQAHLQKEREIGYGAAQDMWKSHFNKTVEVVADYLSTLIDYKLKLAGYEPLINRDKDKTTLRLAYGMEVDERIKSSHFNGIWNNWNEELANWIIYGPDINYSIKT